MTNDKTTESLLQELVDHLEWLTRPPKSVHVYMDFADGRTFYGDVLVANDGTVHPDRGRWLATDGSELTRDQRDAVCSHALHQAQPDGGTPYARWTFAVDEAVRLSHTIDGVDAALTALAAGYEAVALKRLVADKHQHHCTKRAEHLDAALDRTEAWVRDACTRRHFPAVIDPNDGEVDPLTLTEVDGKWRLEWGGSPDVWEWSPFFLTRPTVPNKLLNKRGRDG